MRSALLFFARALLAVVGMGSAMTLLGANPPEFLSPEQTAPGQVTFRFYAPNANAVSVQGLRHRPPVALTRDAEGLWSGTVSDLPADIYTYSFNVDGAMVLDSHNRSFKKWLTSESAVEVTNGTPTVYALQPVPHGVLHRHGYTSAFNGREQACQVYTPPGYDPNARTRYPLIVLCHGYGDDETAWVEMGRANLIADNLIAKGTMKKAVILMPFGHPVQPINRDQPYRNRNYLAFEQELLQQLIPFVEANYRLARNPDNRAILGLSMGGGHALGVGLAHPEVFHWVAGFSSRAPTEELEKRFSPWIQSLKTKQRAPRLLWIGIGREDGLLEGNQTFTAWLKQNGIPFTWRLTDGGHEWSVWREDFAEVAPLLFK